MHILIVAVGFILFQLIVGSLIGRFFGFNDRKVNDETLSAGRAHHASRSS